MHRRTRGIHCFLVFIEFTETTYLTTQEKYSTFLPLQHVLKEGQFEFLRFEQFSVRSFLNAKQNNTSHPETTVGTP